MEQRSESPLAQPKKHKTPKRRNRYKKKKDKPCKNPECENLLKGKQRTYCSRACSQKMYREREAKKKKRA